MTIVYKNKKLDHALVKTRDYHNFDFEAVNVILENCKVSEYEDCKRLLINQRDEIIDKIYYDLMFDKKTGEENDFIPSGCSYDELLAILISIGGVPEVFGTRKQRTVNKIIAEYKGIIQAQEKTIKQYNILIQDQQDIIIKNKALIKSKGKRNKIADLKALVKFKKVRRSANDMNRSFDF